MDAGWLEADEETSEFAGHRQVCLLNSSDSYVW